MKNRQFFFSLIVGLVLISLGTLISTQVPVGTALMSLGGAIIALAALTTKTEKINGKQTNTFPLTHQR